MYANNTQVRISTQESWVKFEVYGYSANTQSS